MVDHKLGAPHETFLERNYDRDMKVLTISGNQGHAHMNKSVRSVRYRLQDNSDGVTP